jgi:broad specificity phosphatase PhoE
MSATSVYLIRHAETTWNAERRFQGTHNSPLSERGQRQVGRLVDVLRTAPLVAVCSSPLVRAQETAQAVAAAHGLPLALIDGLRELDMGEWENRLLDDLAVEDGERLQAWWDAPHTVRPPGGESLVEMQERAVRAFWDLVGAHRGRAIALVAHGGVNKTILLALLGAPLASYWRIRQSNACINLVEVDGQHPRVITLNDTAPLGGDA